MRIIKIQAKYKIVNNIWNGKDLLAELKIIYFVDNKKYKMRFEIRDIGRKYSDRFDKYLYHFHQNDCRKIVIDIINKYGVEEIVKNMIVDDINDNKEYISTNNTIKKDKYALEKILNSYSKYQSLTFDSDKIIKIKKD